MYRFPFLQAAITVPILGNDFLTKYKLLVNLARKQLLDSVTLSVLGMALNSRLAAASCAAVDIAPNVVAVLATANVYVHRLFSWHPEW